jgi:hypothetical protein
MKYLLPYALAIIGSCALHADDATPTEKRSGDNIAPTSLDNSIALAREHATHTDPDGSRWTHLASFSGHQGTNTAPFVISNARWRVKWSASLPPGYHKQDADMLVLYANAFIEGGNGFNKPVCSHDGLGSGTSQMHGAGTYYLAVHTNSAWTMVVEEYAGQSP